jgi:hypothetical protein
MRPSDDMRRAFDDAPGRPDPDAELDPDLEAELDEDFPLGDGTAETEAMVLCPYCGEEVDVGLDPGSGAVQEYVEDCQVCCQPWRVSVVYHEDGSADVAVSALDE